VKVPPLLCPCCESSLTGTLGIEWGDRNNTVQAQMPFICGSCASFLIFHVPSWSLSIPTSEELAIIRTNRPLWEAITDAQNMVRALPNRAPVTPRPGG
jgi:hypothetical protein